MDYYEKFAPSNLYALGTIPGDIESVVVLDGVTALRHPV